MRLLCWLVVDPPEGPRRMIEGTTREMDSSQDYLSPYFDAAAQARADNPDSTIHLLVQKPDLSITTVASWVNTKPRTVH